MTAASAVPVWTPPETLGIGRGVDLAVNAAGDAVAVWSTDQGIKASYRPAGHDWQQPVVVDPSGWGVYGAFVDDAGRATAVWGDTNESFGISDRADNGTWSRDNRAPHPVSWGMPQWVNFGTVAGDSDGNLVVSWSEGDDERWSNGTAWRSADRRWTSGQGWCSGGSCAAMTHGLGTFASGGRAVYAQTSRLGKTVTPRTAIWPGAEVGAPVTAANAQGDLVLAALDGGDPNGYMTSGDPGQLIVLTKPAGEDWRPAFTTDEPDQVRSPRVAISDSGQIAVTYQRASDAALEVRVGDVQGDSAGTPTTLSTDPTTQGPASVAFTPAGAAMATWSTGTSPTNGQALAAYRPADGTWGDPVQIGDHAVGGPTANGYPNGMFTATFFDGSSVQWTDYVDDTVPPRTLVRAAKNFVTSKQFPVRWTATDQQSRPATTDVRVRAADRTGRFGTWTTWKQRTEETSAVFSGKPGHTYCFSARARDRVGNLGAWSTKRCTSTPVDDRTFTRSSGWSRTSHSSSYLGTLTSTRSAQLWLRLDHVHATTLRLLARTCPGCGTIRVTHAGRNLGVFDLTSRRSRTKVILLRHYTKAHTGRLTIRVVGAGKPVQIDGLITSP